MKELLIFPPLYSGHEDNMAPVKETGDVMQLLLPGVVLVFLFVKPKSARLSLAFFVTKVLLSA